MVEGGTAHGWERSMINLSVLGCPLPLYIKEQGGGRPALEGAPGGGILLLVGVGFPSFLLLLGGGKEGGEGEGKGGAPPFLVQFGPEGEGRAACPGRPLSLSPLGPNKAH